MIESVLSLLGSIPLLPRILVIAAIAVAIHMVIQWIERLGERLLSPAQEGTAKARSLALSREHPKLATILSLVVSALTFTVYFAGVGLILRELGVSLGAYIATASVVGLAVGFGSQSLVQDVVVGLTLVFSDAIDIGDVVEISGQVGRVEQIGLRFTTLVNFRGQRVFVPNRNIVAISRFRGGVIRAYADIEIPSGASADQVSGIAERLAQALYNQHRASILEPPELFGVRQSGGWDYVRVKFKLWPGQEALVNESYRQRVVAALKEMDPNYATWRVDVTYRVR